MFWLVCLGVAKLHYGIDMGSQFIKIGVFDSSTNEIRTVEVDSVTSIPAAISLKTTAPKSEHMNANDFKSSSVLVGRAAAKAVHKDPRSGLVYLTQATARVDDVLQTSKFLTPLEFMALFEYQVFHDLPQPDTIAVGVPYVLTAMQKARVMNTFRFGNLPIDGMNEDIYSISELYVNVRGDQLQEGVQRNVLFIDAGAGFFRCYVQNMTRADGNVTSQTLAIEWSEKASGMAFAKALADQTRLPEHEAQSMLRDFGADDADFATNQLAEIVRVIKAAKDKVPQIDEVQVFGGCSKFPFVMAAIESAVGVKNRTNFESMGAGADAVNDTVRRDFDPDRAVIDGLMLTIQRAYREDDAVKVPIHTILRPAWTYFVNYGNQKEMYCQQGFNCRNPTLKYEKGCRLLNITLDPKTVPTGSPLIANVYRLLNLTLVPFDEANPGVVFLNFEFPYPSLRGAGFNKKGGNLTLIEIEPLMYNEHEFASNFEFFKQIVDVTPSEDVQKTEQVNLIQSLIEKISEFTSNVSAEKVDEEFKSILDRLEEIEAMVQDGSLQKKSLAELTQISGEIQDFVPTIGGKLF